MGFSGYALIVVAYIVNGLALWIALGMWLTLAIFAVRGLRRGIRPPREFMALGIVVMVVAFFAVSLATLSESFESVFAFGQHILGGTLPSDAYIPADFARFTINNLPTHQFHGDWNGSDRPPLQAGLVILFGVLARGPFAELGTSFDGYAGSFAAQTLAVVAAYALSRSVGFGTHASRIGVLFAGATLTWVVNSVFTWPKLLAAGLALSAMTLLVEALRGRLAAGPALAGAIVASTLAFLSHGSSAFAIIAVACVAIPVVKRAAFRDVARDVSIGIGAAVVLYAPWAAYQRVIDPPGDRLLKWHLAGVIPPNSHTFTHDLMAAYSELGWAGALRNRLDGLRNVFWDNPLKGIATNGGLSERAAAEFFSTYAALSLGFFTLLTFLAMALWSSARHRRRWRDMEESTRLTMGLLAAGVAGTLAWILVIFEPSGLLVHQGSHVWLTVWLVLPVAWLARRYARRAPWLVFAQAVITVFLIAIPWWANSAVGFAWPTLTVALASFALVASAFASRSGYRGLWRPRRVSRERRRALADSATDRSLP
jgi:hypothetical protein